MKRQLINTDPLKICGICAAITFAFVANSAQAQTMCPAGQENVRGICQTICPQGQTRVTSPHFLEEMNTRCFDNAFVSILDACEDAGWDGREATGAQYFLGNMICLIPSNLGTRTASITANDCNIVLGSGSGIACTDMYGDPPVFPKAADHPAVRPFVGTSKFFVANCDRDGNVPGGYPDINRNGATECVCNPGSHFGDWPSCTPGPRLRLRLFLEGPLR